MILDRRLHAYRPDLAEENLKEKIEAERYVAGEKAVIRLPKIGLRPKPDVFSNIDTELLYGEAVTVFDRSDGWAWVKSEFDSYVGYLPQSALGDASDPTHRIVAPRSFLYPEPDMKRPPIEALSIGSRLVATGEAETRGTRYLITTEGAVIADHTAPFDGVMASDYVSIAARLVDTPYLWGGRSAFGIDCSGLVQLSLMMAGKAALRDSDQQEQTLGVEISRNDLERGDLVFWKGHVAIIEDEDTILHANGKTMLVSRERLSDAIERIEPLYGLPRTYRRP